MLYNVSIMVNLWGALTSRDVRLLKNQIGELDMPYSQPLHEYLAAHQGLTAVVAVPVGTQA